MDDYQFTPNLYRIEGSIAFLALHDQRGKITHEAIIDAADLTRVLHYGRWSKVNNTRQPYKSPYVWCKMRHMPLHRFILGSEQGVKVDHIDGDPLNCRRSNLRVCTTSQNAQNRCGAVRGSRSGIRNVHWDKERSCWQVTLKVQGKRIRIGRFQDIAEAEAAAIEGRRRYMPFSLDSTITAV